MFLLTDEEPDLLAGGPGLSLDRSEPADDLLLDDLRSDVGMEWVPEDMWFTYLQVDAEAARPRLRPRHLRRRDARSPTMADTGVPAPEARPIDAPGAGRPGVADGRRRGRGRDPGRGVPPPRRLVAAPACGA